MINYYLQLINTRLVRFYLFLLLVSIFINTIIFECIFLIFDRQFFLYLLIILSGVFFFFNSIIYNFKENYLIHKIYLDNLSIMLKFLSKTDKSLVSSWPPDKIHEIIGHGNHTIDNLLLCIETTSIFMIKLVVTFVIMLLFKPHLINLFFITLIVCSVNLYLLFKQNREKKTIKMDLLYHTVYYLIHYRLNFLLKHFQNQFDFILKNSEIKNNSSFVYINLIILCIYLFFIKSAEDRLYVIIFARNSSYFFTLIQQFTDQYLQIKKYCDTNDDLLNLPHKERSIVKNESLSSLVLCVMDKITEPIHLFPGDRIIVYGDSGCGKSTLFNQLKNLSTRPVEIMMNEVKYDSFAVIEKQILLIRGNSFRYFHCSLRSFIIDNLENDDELLLELFEMMEMKDFDIDDVINSNNISTGQMRRVILIKSFYQLIKLKYKIALFDEPDDGLQESLFISILQKILTHSALKNVILMIISHNPRLQTNTDLFTGFILVTKEKISFHTD